MGEESGRFDISASLRFYLKVEGTKDIFLADSTAFYVSFVVTPLCSNASELVSSLIFAAKKKKENISMTFAQVIIM